MDILQPLTNCIKKHWNFQNFKISRILRHIVTQSNASSRAIWTCLVTFWEHNSTQNSTFYSLAPIKINENQEFNKNGVQNQWIPFWILMDLLENCWLHQAVTFCLFGVRSQPRYLKVSTPRAWSIARVKSRVARFYALKWAQFLEFQFWRCAPP